MASNHSPFNCLPSHARIEADLRPLDRLPREQAPQLVLIRGLPGSGKSTLARTLVDTGYKHFEADMFFIEAGQYRYQASRIRDAHAWCQARTRDTLRCGQRAVVSNTFTRLSELRPYLEMTGNIVVVHTFGAWTNLHDVPASVVRSMDERWEHFLRESATGPVAASNAERCHISCAIPNSSASASSRASSDMGIPSEFSSRTTAQ